MRCVAFALLAALAALASGACGDRERPRAQARAAVVITAAWPGAASEQIEQSIVDVLEVGVHLTEGIAAIESRIDDGNAVITLEVRHGTEPMVLAQHIRNAVALLRPHLPQDADLPVVQQVNLAPPAVWLAIESDRSRLETADLVEELVIPRLERLAGVAGIDRHGLVRPAVIVVPDLERMRAIDLTPGELAAAIRTQNTNVPGGRIDDRATTLRVTGTATSVDDVQNMVVAQRGAQSLRLRDLARVELGIENEPEAREARLAIHAQLGAARLDVRETVRVALNVLSTSLPPGMRLREAPPPVSDSTVLVASIRGPDREMLAHVANAVVSELAAAGVKDVVRDPSGSTLEMNVDIKRDRAAALGVSVGEVASTIELATGSAVVGELTEGARTRRILLRFAAKLPDALADVQLRGHAGVLVPLSTLASVSEAPRHVLLRRDRERAIDLRAPEAAVGKVRAFLEQRHGKWPSGTRVVLAR